MLWTTGVQLSILEQQMAVGQDPSTLVNIPKAFEIDYLGVVIIPEKATLIRFCPTDKSFTRKRLGPGSGQTAAFFSQFVQTGSERKATEFRSARWRNERRIKKGVWAGNTRWMSEKFIQIQFTSPKIEFWNVYLRLLRAELFKPQTFVLLLTIILLDMCGICVERRTPSTALFRFEILWANLLKPTSHKPGRHLFVRHLLHLPAHLGTCLTFEAEQWFAILAHELRLSPRSTVALPLAESWDAKPWSLGEGGWAVVLWPLHGRCWWKASDEELVLPTFAADACCHHQSLATSVDLRPSNCLSASSCSLTRGVPLGLGTWEPLAFSKRLVSTPKHPEPCIDLFQQPRFLSGGWERDTCLVDQLHGRVVWTERSACHGGSFSFTSGTLHSMQFVNVFLSRVYMYIFVLKSLFKEKPTDIPKRISTEITSVDSKRGFRRECPVPVEG